MKNIKELKNKKIAILGLGIENYALVKYLLTRNSNKQKGGLITGSYRSAIAPLRDDKLDITICDRRSAGELKERYSVIASVAKQSRKSGKTRLPRRSPLASSGFASRNDIIIRWKLGKDYDKDLDYFNIIFRSPGYPLLKIKNQKSKIKNIISSPMKAFFELCPTKNIIGVTGTKGKGTTSSLIYHILKNEGKRVWLGGNIGVAPFEFINKIKPNDWVVLELSSFQLEDMDKSPKIAVITNFFREHLAPADPNNPNYHKSMHEYRTAKMNIVKFQKKGDAVIVNKNLKSKISNLKTKTKNLKPKGKLIFFEKSNLKSMLVGEHNKENVAAAVEAAKFIGIKQNIIIKAIKDFKGLEYRLEFVKEEKGIKYYNDSFATTPESTIIALKSFANPIILLVGGAEKNSDFKKLAREIKNKVKFTVLLNGRATPRIKNELLKINFPANKINVAHSIKEAVKMAETMVNKGDIILLSPACASFGMFKNYKARGELFKKEVKK
ncbi:UDP-N-acetylmuramoyl-L-alanine--D-glutamate ligase [Candidatus Falkowbacteria bacterium CG_4_9_14_3_um_filter_36_9]|uniref:UDP-N-acetylmuramoylalanine--D-glutamate ligase n=1 Tax=Candidatus Falkowbacteria bacterium CG02_land_8_20_14_3_00_36_14 TaxID=1974560 RepID=A0A2M7DQH3_9BACT|nr:MAG: UDP-N-acetylmuramoyl-L-alanine--D-glutamate ligase [Candidatus Falkowbacteria bacterium CG02_land_8_20_14_3_00_36_14]PIX11326.1 MAG: UDP-N-acetylmuramoyl-L-alanine--D-glutamate ligase [Candidatus Falkowbacteria bacterium CG_4_8_14_3_um_filter_36_11]PJB20343.1 MAG: UDP-N-acetylmuramoyl-L-alanine--D-glutamate ligase [Candidatus Falkowbacteria bacterium CG_4_9_14_3_um_filter_36_9]